MGKAQSKRSVDITTETKEGVAGAEGDSGKVGKIEDIDQAKPQLNGDANKDADAGEKQDEKKDDAENEKDAATEKKDESATPESASATATETKTANDEKPTTNGDEAAADAAETKPTENGDGTEAADTTLNESKDAAETGDDATSPTDSAKKPKKEKSKKRFLSFRSFSFSKKDKSKPKKEENAANTTNGEIEKVPEEATEEAANAVTNGEEKTDAEPTTNGTSEEAKVNGAPVATPEESVTPPPATNNDEKPIAEIKQVAEETVKEAIVAASKSVDEKINAIVAKPEVNEQVSQNQNTSTTQAIDTSVELIENDSSENANANANSEQVPNNIDNNEITQTTQTIQIQIETKTNEIDNNIIVPETNQIGLVDCTKNDPINNIQVQISEPPALPECPPPSQITVFAETAMSIEQNSIPIVETEKSNIVDVIDEQLAAGINNVNLDFSESELKSQITDEIQSNDMIIIAENATNESEFESEPVPVPEPVVNETDDSKQNTSYIGTDDGESITNPATAIKDDVESIEISSPLPQNSLETLPSPQSSSNVTPPNEIDDIATNEPNDISLPPPPADLIDTENNDTETATATTTTELPPPITEHIDDINGSDLDAKNHDDDNNDDNDDDDVEIEATTNGGAELLNGSSHTTTNGNGVAHDHDAANDHSEKENGVANDKEISVSEKMNGDSDHKTIEEIATSPEKLEKLAAANPPPSTEVVAAE